VTTPTVPHTPTPTPTLAETPVPTPTPLDTPAPSPTTSIQPELSTWVLLAAAPDHVAWAIVSSCVDDACHAAVERSTVDGPWKVLYRFEQPSSYAGGFALVVASPTDVWAGLGGDGDRATVVTHDGGATWRPVMNRFLAGLTSTRATVWALLGGDLANGHGSTVAVGPATSDTLSPVAAPPHALAGGFQPSLAVTDNGTAFVASGDSDEIDVSDDGGQRWQSRRSPCPPHHTWSHALDWAAGALWLVCSEEPSTGAQRKAVYRSGDGGRTWSGGAVEFGGYADSITASGAQSAWRFGARAPIYRTVDGGRSWSAQLGELFGDAGGGRTVNSAIAAADGGLLVSSGVDVYRADAAGHVLAHTVVTVP